MFDSDRGSVRWRSTTRSADSGFGGASSSCDAAVVRDHQLLEQVRVQVRLADGVHDRRRVEAQVEEDAHVAELQVGVDERRLALQPAGQGDGGVDGDGGGAHAALGAVEAGEAAERQLLGPGLRLLPLARARQQRLDARDQLERVERLDDVVVGTGAQALDPLLHVRLGGQHDDRDAPARRSRRRGSAASPRSRRASASPRPSGSGRARRDAAISTPAWPSEATCTSYPSCLRVKTRTRWIFRSSSTTRTFVAAMRELWRGGGVNSARMYTGEPMGAPMHQ